jgi:short-subunit dehydrogenase
MAKAQLKVFITGASSGIVQALAREYSNQGAILGLVARREPLLNTLKQTLNTECSVYPLDVRDQEALQKAAHDFITKYGIPDVVIANAGVSAGTLTEHKADTATFKALMDINVIGMVNTFQPFMAGMKKTRQGRLVGIASIAGVRGLPGAGAYSASKAAAIAYLESLRVEMSKEGVSVTTIAPGYIKTPMTDINQYPMPFLMDADIAAKKFARAIAQKKRFVVIPWQMGWLAKFMRILPPWLWDFAMKNAPHKAHANWDWL